MKILSFYNSYIGRTIALLAGVVALSAFLYGGFLLGAVAHVAGRTQAEHKVRSLSVEVGVLESHYLAHTKALSPTRAADLGFVAPVAVTTVYASAHPGLTLR